MKKLTVSLVLALAAVTALSGGAAATASSGTLAAPCCKVNPL